MTGHIGMGLTPKVHPETRAWFGRVWLGLPSAVLNVGGVRMLFIPIVESPQVILFSEGMA